MLRLSNSPAHSRYIRSLEELDVEGHLRYPPAAPCSPSNDPLFDSKKLRHVLVRHEQGAGHAASGYATPPGRSCVMMATSGPGATNLVTPLADAQMDSIPVVAVTGQGRPRPDRHGRLPGGRHPPASPCRSPSTTSGPRRRRHPAGDGRGLPHRRQRTAVRGARRHPERTCCKPVHVQLAATDGSAWLQAEHQTAQPSDQRGRQADTPPRTNPCSTSAAGSSAARPPNNCGELAELTGIPVVTTLMARGAFPDSTASTWVCRVGTAPSQRWPGCSAATC